MNPFLDFSIFVVAAVAAVGLLSTGGVLSLATSSSVSTMMVYCINSQFDVKPECSGEFVRLMKQNGAATMKNEEGALEFVMGQDTAKADKFHVHEQYQSPKCHELHEKNEHVIQVLEFFKTSPFSQDPIIETFLGTHPPIKVPSRPAFCLNVKLCINPEVREEFLRVINNNQKGSHKEPLCLQYEYGESDAVSNTFHFHEQYTGSGDGKEGFDAHAATPHFAAWEAFASGGDANTFTSPPTVSFYKSLTLSEF
jgi:quinol monooxygenase YgiN